MNNAVAHRTNFATDLDNYESQIAAALPSHISVDKFKRVATTAVSRNPDLYTKGDKRALFNACVQCASDGLLPDGREAALVMFKGKPQYLPMVAGVIKRMRNSGDVVAVDSQVIHQNDHFDYQLGDDARITHKPTLGDPGKVIGAYAIITLASGERLREVMSVAQIDKVRAVSRASRDDSPWNQWYGEMARKTVLKRCAKRAPTTPDLERLLSRDDVPEPSTAIAPPKPTRASFAMTADEAEPEREVDPASAGHEDLDERFRATVDEDGEIHDDSAPSVHAPASSPVLPSSVEPQAPAEAEGPQDAYDAAAIAASLLDGATLETTAGGLTAYWDIQKPIWAELKRRDPKVYAGLYEAINKMLKALRNGGTPACPPS